MITYLIEVEKSCGGSGFWIWNTFYKSRIPDLYSVIPRFQIRPFPLHFGDVYYSDTYCFWFKVKHLLKRFYDNIFN